MDFAQSLETKSQEISTDANTPLIEVKRKRGRPKKPENEKIKPLLSEPKKRGRPKKINNINA